MADSTITLAVVVTTSVILIATIISKVQQSLTNDVIPEYARDCNDIAAQGHSKSGMHIIRPIIYPIDAVDDEAYNSKFKVYCDLESEDGAWTVFQQRGHNGLVNFYRDWQDYKRGFGYLESEFWLGLDKLHRLTTQARYRLKVVLEKANGDTAYATYDNFKIGDEEGSYKLLLGDYEGTAGDSMTYHAGMLFSTKDRDNDNKHSTHCAKKNKGGWWYNECQQSNLNGLYSTPGVSDINTGIRWYFWKRDESMKSSEMKIRRID